MMNKRIETNEQNRAREDYLRLIKLKSLKGIKMVNFDSILPGINGKDERCWEQLYTSCYAAMCVYVESIVKDMDSSKDIVQDLLVSLWHSDVQFASSKELMGYLYKSLYHNSLVYIRNKKKRASILDKIDKEKEEEDFSKDFLLDTVQEEIVRLLYLHIGDLPRMRKQIIKLSISGFSGKEIADKLGISVNTVKVQKNKSIKYLRDRLMHRRRELDL